MLSPERRRRLVEIAVFAVPIIMLKTTSLLFGGGGAAEVEGSTPAANDALVSALAEPVSMWTAEQTAAANYVTQLREQPFGPTPLRHNVAPHRPVDPQVTETEHPLEVKLTGIIQGAGGAVAWIDGDPVRVGDTVQQHRWEVVEIDAIGRAVRFRHTASGEETVRKLPMPR